MAGAFSGHLLDSYNAQQSWSEGPTLITSGAMSFNPQMHGTPAGRSFFTGDTSFGANMSNMSMPMFSPEVSEETALKIAQLQAKLNQKLGPEFISQRPGPTGGPKLTYAEGWKIINLANEVFGFNGWSSSIVNLTTDFVDFNEETKKYNVGTTAVVRVTLRDGVFHEDVGYGMSENSKSKGAALDKCKKEAVTDGLKRSLRNFGNLLGNCLYDKSYTKEVVKINVPQPKFDKSQLYRRPEFEEKKPDVSMLSGCISFDDSTSTPKVNMNASATPSKPPQGQQRRSVPAEVKPPGPIPKHIQTAVNMASGSSTSGLANTNPSHLNTNTKNPSTTDPRVAATGGTSTHNRAMVAPQNVPKPKPEPPAPAKTETDNALLEDLEDSFHFYSDDDAFLANVDMGEGDIIADLGRPIGGEDDDEDLGRPIDPSEGLGGRSPSDLSSTSRDEPQQKEPHPPGNANTEISSRMLIGSHVDGLQRPRPSGTSMAPASRPHAPPAPHVNSAPTARSSVMGAQGAIAANHGGATSTRASFAPTAASGSSSTNPAQQRPTTPSMGGFNFPPGMNAKQLNQQGMPPTLQNHPHRSTSTIGQKRPSDAMSSSGASGYKNAGMGLGSHTNNSSHGFVQRQPLRPLEISEGGDVKRIRR